MRYISLYFIIAVILVSCNQKPKKEKFQYERIQDARGGISVVEINSSACGGCGAFIPPQIVSEVRLGENTQTCDSCSRFLYWDSE